MLATSLTSSFLFRVSSYGNWKFSYNSSFSISPLGVKFLKVFLVNAFFYVFKDSCSMSYSVSGIHICSLRSLGYTYGLESLDNFKVASWARIDQVILYVYIYKYTDITFNYFPCLCTNYHWISINIDIQWLISILILINNLTDLTN